ncbi:MAG: cation:proton antiporter, partial [Oligoflexia bacterium]|nr:cation:proton antiporter [Oligoflexia bacterium]
TMIVIALSMAFILGFIARQLRQPPLLGYLVAGFVLNYIGFKDDHYLKILSDFGITLLIFTIGLKINIKKFFRKELVCGATLHLSLLTTIYVSFFLFFAALNIDEFKQLDKWGMLLIAFAFSFSSTVYAVKVLEDKGELTSFYGTMAIGILVIQDIFAVMYMVITSGVSPSLWALSIPVVLIVSRPILLFFLKKIGHGELFILFGLFLAYVPGVYLFESVGLKGDLGVLIVGILVANHPRAKELSNNLLEFKDIFLIGFFLLIGLSIDLSYQTVLIALLFALGINLKVFLYFIVLTRFKLRARTALLTSLTLANYSEFGLIVLSLGASAGIINNSWPGIFAIALAISFVVSTPLNIYAHNIFENLHNFLHKFETKKRLAYDKTFDVGLAKVLIFGMGNVGKATYLQLFKGHGQEVVGLDNDEDVVDELKKDGLNILHDDATDSDFWERVQNDKLDQIKLVILCMSDHQANIYSLERLKSINYQGEVVAIAKYDDQLKELKSLGVDSAYNLYAEAGVGLSKQSCQILQTCGIVANNDFAG